MTATLTKAEAFRKYHNDNPQVADRLEDMARRWFAAGNSKVAVKMLTEVLRWTDGVADVETADLYRFNNNHVPHYARLLIERNPAWANKIPTREIRTA